MNSEERLEPSADLPFDADRRAQLLADWALEGLSDEERAELEQLGTSEQEQELWERTAAATFLAIHSAEDEKMPERLRQRVLAEADVRFARSAKWRGGGRLTIVPWLGWIAAAACLIALVTPNRPVGRAPEPSLRERLAGVPPLKFVASEHPLARGAGGELVWSGDRQEGFLVLRGLAEVEPSRGVYQLWIFDDTRDPRFPIDGGTFTISDARSSTVVPIRANLPVRQPTLFAVTLEPPGGVVVSDRKRLLLTASLSR
jgi:anti-sigma-K factor RskA